MEEKQVINALTAIAHPLRLRVFRALVVAGPAGQTPGVIQEAQQVPPTTLSFHLKELVNSGLVTQERAGRNLVYRAVFENMNGLIAYLTDHCCEGVACGVETVAADCKC